MLEPKIHLALDRLSNDEFDQLRVDPAWIDEAGEALKDALHRQLGDTGKNDFRLRMSNVGKPLCQLQMADAGAKEARKPYNFKMMMMLGDAVEVLTELILKIAGINITGGKDQVSLDVEGTVINGTDDVEIDHKVFDIKSCSPSSFDYKWSDGYEHFKKNDDFGYVGQLIGYAKAKSKEPGGWITVCKSTGRVKVLLCDSSKEEKAAVSKLIKDNVQAVVNKSAFKRCFEPEDEKWRGKPTGRKHLCKTCGYCSFLGACWPDAEYKPHPNSKSKTPPRYWYVDED